MSAPDPAIWRQSRTGRWYKRDGDGKAPYEMKACQNCGAVTMILAKGRFCSPGCSDAWLREHKVRGPDHPSFRADVGYKSRHRQVAAARGKASTYFCVDGCGRRAHDWSQIHGTDPANPASYAPRCRKCHHAYDIALRARGEGITSSKLTEAQVRGIRASVGAAQYELAEHFGVEQPLISQIHRRKIWRHVR